MGQVVGRDVRGFVGHGGSVVADDRYRIHRQLHRRRRNNTAVEVATARLSINGVHQPQITPSSAAATITAVTGLTGRAMAGAFFIPQGHLTALAEGTPTDVQRLIETQTGLTPLTRKLEAANHDAHLARGTAHALPGSRDDLDAAQAAVDAAQTDPVAAWDRHTTTTTAAADTARAALDAANATHSRLRNSRDTAVHARLTAARATERVHLLDTQLATLDADHAAARAAAGGVARRCRRTRRAPHLLR